MDVYKICALALLCVSAGAFLKQSKAELLPSLRIAAILAIAFCAVYAAEPLIAYLRTLADLPLLAEQSATLFKALGIAILTQACSQLCRECGENGIADGVETVGKIELLLLALPFLENILHMTDQLLSLGGIS